MPLIVGNLLTDPSATSFISFADADAYLAAEMHAEWAAATLPAQEAALVRASRWLAASLPWARAVLSDSEVLRVGQVAARLAASALTVDLYAPADAKGPIKRAKAGSVEVEYAGVAAEYQAGGRYWPWLTSQLVGLLVAPRTGIGIMVI